MVIRKLLLASLIVLLGTESAFAETREEIEARIRALSTELYQLRQQLQQVEDPTESESTPPQNCSQKRWRLRISVNAANSSTSRHAIRLRLRLTELIIFSQLAIAPTRTAKTFVAFPQTLHLTTSK